MLSSQTVKLPGQTGQQRPGTGIGSAHSTGQITFLHDTVPPWQEQDRHGLEGEIHVSSFSYSSPS